MQPKIFYPHPVLRPYVQYYICVALGASDAVLKVPIAPPGYAIMGVRMSDSRLLIKDGDNGLAEAPQISFTGQLTRFRLIEVTDSHEMFYIVFKPCGPFQLLGIPQHLCTDKSEDLTSMLAAGITTEIRHRLEDARTIPAVRQIVERFLLQLSLSGKKRPGTDRIAYVAEQVAMRCREPQLIRNLCRNEGFTKSTLDRQIKATIGLTPKQYQLITRFNTVLSYIRQQKDITHWTRIAYRFGYYDQAHFIKEFKHFYGKVPTQYSTNDELLSNIAHL